MRSCGTAVAVAAAAISRCRSAAAGPLGEPTPTASSPGSSDSGLTVQTDRPRLGQRFRRGARGSIAASEVVCTAPSAATSSIKTEERWPSRCPGRCAVPTRDLVLPSRSPRRRHVPPRASHHEADRWFRHHPDPAGGDRQGAARIGCHRQPRWTSGPGPGPRPGYRVGRRTTRAGGRLAGADERPGRRPAPGRPVRHRQGCKQRSGWRSLGCPHADDGSLRRPPRWGRSPLGEAGDAACPASSPGHGRGRSRTTRSRAVGDRSPGRDHGWQFPTVHAAFSRWRFRRPRGPVSSCPLC